MKTSDHSFLSSARIAAARCGVTRLADITGLDRLGLPVWQAVRPAGRSLSVHQGKALDHRGAKIGALCEAIESHSAEQAEADGPLCRWSALPEVERVSVLEDFARVRRGDFADRPIPWCTATDLVTGQPAWLPQALVSLDFTRGLPSPFHRSSDGLGAGPTERDALRTALLECLERDAVGEWQRRPEDEQKGDRIDPGSIAYHWFIDWRERLAAHRVALDIFRFGSLAGFPVCLCVIGAAAEFGEGYRRFFGSNVDPDPESALFGALAEAIQSRLTLIAGVRDDILPDHYTCDRLAGPPLAAAPTGAAWCEARPVRDAIGATIAGLAAAGYRRILFKRLDRDLAGVAVVKAFVPGLGSHQRTRRVMK